MSTFSKANKTRESECFQQICSHLMLKVKQKHSCSGIVLFPVVSTVITLTSQLVEQLAAMANASPTATIDLDPLPDSRI